jgi:hypothetical protein
LRRSRDFIILIYWQEMCWGAEKAKAVDLYCGRYWAKKITGEPVEAMPGSGHSVGSIINKLTNSRI